MKKRYLLGLLVAAVLLVIAKLGPEAAITSPGHLDADHADIPCLGCHTAFESFDDNDKCVECHQENVLTPLGRFAESRCTDCHGEHMGADAELTEVSVRECARCHDRATVHDRAPVVLAEKLERPPGDCLECHTNHDEHRLHTEPTLAAVRKNLVGAHRRANPLFHKETCEKCHQDMRTASSSTAASVEGFFDPHVTHVGRLEIRCTWCHTDVDIRQSSGTSARKLADVERCAQCHAGEYFPATAANAGGGS